MHINDLTHENEALRNTNEEYKQQIYDLNSRVDRLAQLVDTRADKSENSSEASQTEEVFEGNSILKDEIHWRDKQIKRLENSLAKYKKQKPKEEVVKPLIIPAAIYSHSMLDTGKTGNESMVATSRAQRTSGTHKQQQNDQARQKTDAELAKAKIKIETLEKENALLKSSRCSSN